MSEVTATTDTLTDLPDAHAMHLWIRPDLPLHWRSFGDMVLESLTHSEIVEIFGETVAFRVFAERVARRCVVERVWRN